MRFQRADGVIGWLMLLGMLLPGMMMARDAGQTDREPELAIDADLQPSQPADDGDSELRRAEERVRSEESRGADGHALSAAYHQLGKAQLRAGHADAAVKSLQQALQLLAATETLTSPRWIEPLIDLAEADAALGEHAAAIEAMRQAIAIGRRSSGLFNVEQIELLERMAVSLEAVGDIAGVDRARRFAVLAAEQQFGSEHPDSVPAIERLASWFELTGRYEMAGELYERTATIAARESDGRSATVIHALLGLGRSHRLQYVETPELVDVGVWGLPPSQKYDPVTGQRKPIAGYILGRPRLDAAAKLDRRGRDALMQSLEILGAVADPPPELLASTFIEIGDWYQTDRDSARAIAYYKRAWPLLEVANGSAFPNPLLAPRPMFYRLPPKLRQNRRMQQGQGVERRAEFVMTISARGEVSELAHTGGDMLEGNMWQVAHALNRATFSPRFENGEPVATSGFAFTAFGFDPEREKAAAPAAAVER